MLNNNKNNNKNKYKYKMLTYIYLFVAMSGSVCRRLHVWQQRRERDWCLRLNAFRVTAFR